MTNFNSQISGLFRSFLHLAFDWPRKAAFLRGGDRGGGVDEISRIPFLLREGKVNMTMHTRNTPKARM